MSMNHIGMPAEAVGLDAAAPVPSVFPANAWTTSSASGQASAYHPAAALCRTSESPSLA